MKSRLMHITLALAAILLVSFLVGGIIASGEIRPANQLPDRGVGDQLRPANQLDLSSSGNGGYAPSQGSKYSSSPVAPGSKVNLKAILNSSNVVASNSSKSNLSSATGVGTFVLDTVADTLMYNITFQGLSSIETSADINGPASTGENAGILFNLPTGSPKVGTLQLDENTTNLILNSETYVSIQSILFPNGELRGQIEKITTI